MSRFDFFEKLPGLLMTAAFALVCASVPAFADDPASPAPAVEPAKASFTKFARSWMEKVQRLAAEEKATLQPGPNNTTVTYRSYDDDFDVELRPTGHAAAPWVGILRYQEQVYSCSDMAANNCTLSSRTPVTEIFRYQDGRWVY